MCYATCVLNVHKCVFSCDIEIIASRMLILEQGGKGFLLSILTQYLMECGTELIPIQVYKDEAKPHVHPAHRRRGHKPTC